ncbi:MAG: YbaB/EbfC family nucleoid-associated protein [Flavobacteriales bacterium]|nr:YbaB/EbfC family nucleoid-associated protein [Flavobacteriales bacterium]
MMGNMMEKLMAMQQQMEESKKRLENIQVEAESPEGAVKVVFTGNKSLKSVHISPEWLQNADAEQLEDYLVIAVNKGLKQAESVWESEMKGMAGSMIPGLGL